MTKTNKRKSTSHKTTQGDLYDDDFLQSQSPYNDKDLDVPINSDHATSYNKASETATNTVTDQFSFSNPPVSISNSISDNGDDSDDDEDNKEDAQL